MTETEGPGEVQDSREGTEGVEEVRDVREGNRRRPGRRKEDVEKEVILAAHRRDRKLWSGGFIILLAFTAFGFLRTDDSNSRSREASEKAEKAAVQAEAAAARAEEAVEKVEIEALERDFTQCTNSNDLRATIVTFFGGLAAQSAEPGQEEEVAEFLDLVGRSFAAVECPPDPSSLGGG